MCWTGVMPFGQDSRGILKPDMVTGVHLRCLGDWMNRDRQELLAHYRKDLETAAQWNAEYVVFHVTQVDDEEGFSYQPKHSDREVVLAAADFINELLDGTDYPFAFLMENLWWPGLNFLDPEITDLLLERVETPNKGLMLDTGHFLHTNHELQTQADAVAYLEQMLDAHEAFLPNIKGIHLQQSLTGAYVKDWLTREHVLPEDPNERMCQVYTHIFSVDRHLPFTDPGVRNLVKRIAPDYVTYEYITESREQLAEYMEKGRDALMGADRA